LQIDITFTAEDGKEVRINTTPNSWIHKNQGTRIFYATGLAYLPSATPPALVEWRQAELVEIKVREAVLSLLQIWLRNLLCSLLCTPIHLAAIAVRLPALSQSYCALQVQID
jgi:hypothetical protein